MGFMLSFVLIGSLVLQVSINALGTALATYCGQNLGAKEYVRIKKGRHLDGVTVYRKMI